MKAARGGFLVALVLLVARCSAPPPVPPASLSAAVASSAATPASRPPPLPRMHEAFGPRVCGLRSYLGHPNEDPGFAVLRQRGGGECFSVAGCPPPDVPDLVPIERCPDVPVVSVGQLVREAAATWDGRRVVVRGRLALANGRYISLLGSTPPLCGEAGRLLGLEAVVDGACFAVDLEAPQCLGDASRVCCDHLPLGGDVAIVGLMTRPADEHVFAASLSSSKLCTLPTTAAPTPPSSSARPSAVAPAPPR